MATEMRENSDDEDFVQERDNRRRQRLPEGGRHINQGLKGGIVWMLMS